MSKRHHHPETPVKRDLADHLRKRFLNYVIVRIENSASNGLPDIMIFGDKIASQLEVKFAKPEFPTKEDQELMMKRLAREGFAKYAVFYEVGKVKATFLVDPKDIGKPIESWNNFVLGHDYLWIGNYVEDLHRDNHKIRT